MLNSRKKTGVLVTLCLTSAALSGCNASSTGPSPLGIEEPLSVTASHQANAERPLRMTGTGFLEGQQLAPGFGPPTFGKSLFGGRCSVPSDFMIQFSLIGEATHIGRYGADLEHCTQIDWSTGLSGQTDGVATIRAANGDEIWDEYVGPPAADAPEVHTFVGGTGRFVGAYGGGEAHVVCDRAAGTCQFELTGQIGYDASNRSDS